MKLDEIKAELYIQKPLAIFSHIRSGVAYYYTFLNGKEVHFHVPIYNIENIDFGRTVAGQLLAEWAWGSSEKKTDYVRNQDHSLEITQRKIQEAIDILEENVLLPEGEPLKHTLMYCQHLIGTTMVKDIGIDLLNGDVLRDSKLLETGTYMSVEYKGEPCLAYFLGLIAVGCTTTITDDSARFSYAEHAPHALLIQSKKIINLRGVPCNTNLDKEEYKVIWEKK